MRNLSLLSLIIFAFACSDQKIDTTKAREGLKSQEIQVVSDANILERASEMGSQYLAIETIMVTADGNFSIELTDSLNFKANEVFYRFGEESSLTGKAQEVLDAYNYNFANDVKSSTNVQFSANKEFIIYTSPVQFEGKEIGVFLIQIPRKGIVLSFAD
jgi:hypothetical protein